MKNKRIIDTFAARDLKMPEGQEQMDSLSEYSLRERNGLELRKRRRKRKNRTVI